MKRSLSDAQERRLLRKHTSGDFGPGKWDTIQSLIDKGMVTIQNQKVLVVTPKGKQYCDEFHTLMNL